MKVVIVGATHGNEKTGAWLIEKWKAHPELLPSHHEYLFLIGNPKALEQNTRYVDFDLNRSFNGGNHDSKTYEYHRARELKNRLKEWSKGEDFFLIDLHTTTSNMGTTLILSDKERLNACILKQVHDNIPDSKLLFSFFDHQNIYLNSLSPYGLLVEIGPAPHNLLVGEAIERMEKATLEALKALPATYPKSLEPVELDGYLEGEEVLFPLWDEHRKGTYIHPEFQNKDFDLLQKGDPIFVTQEEQIIHYEGEDTYPVFINEAAYYVKNYAFTKSSKTRIIF